MKHSRIRGRSRRGVRRRRGARRREIVGTVIRCLAFLALLAICAGGVEWARRELHRSLIILDQPPAGAGLTVLAGLPRAQIFPRNQRPVYPYSVVPGGVGSTAELRDRTAHDPVVAKHYAGFHFERARLIQVERPQLVYLSYRRGQQVYWTRKQASLHKGEMLITDGQITARTRCGNQVSTLPHTETSPEEPTMAEFDRPDAMASGIEHLNSSLLQVDPILPVGPAMPGGGGIFGGPGTNVPPPIGGGGGIPPVVGTCPPKSTDKNCQHTPPPPSPPPPVPAPVPEPSTVVLMISGAAAVFARLGSARK